jgi:hypothetical protein
LWAQQDYLNNTFGGGRVTPSHVRGLNEIHPTTPKTKVSVIIPTALTTNLTTKELFAFQAISSLRQQETHTTNDVN